MDKTQIKATIQSLRHSIGKPQKEIASAAGISIMSYYRYEYGERIPDACTATVIAAALGSTVEAIWGNNTRKA